MQFDFTTMLDRVGKDAMAVEMLGDEGGFAPGAPLPGYDAIPMWVADMNFPTAPSVVNAIMERAAHPAFGYFRPPKAYYDAIIGWHERRHGVQGLQPEHIGYQNGVLGGLVSACGAFTSPGDSVLVNSPTYIGFTRAIERCGRFLERSPLVRDEMGVWRMDYDDMSRRISEKRISLVVMCSPYNPCGRVWEREELERAAEVFAKHDVVVVADEIWSDLVFPGHAHIPLQDVSPYAREHVLAAYAPSKTFNIAGLIGSYHIIYNEELRDRVTKEGDLTNYNEMNVLSMHALIGGYSSGGREWVKELNRTLEGNAGFASEFIHRNFPQVHTAMPQGTYMMWLDLKEYLERSAQTLDDVLHAGCRSRLAGRQAV